MQKINIFFNSSRTETNHDTHLSANSWINPSLDAIHVHPIVSFLSLSLSLTLSLFYCFIIIRIKPNKKKCKQNKKNSIAHTPDTDTHTFFALFRKLDSIGTSVSTQLLDQLLSGVSPKKQQHTKRFLFNCFSNQQNNLAMQIWKSFVFSFPLFLENIPGLYQCLSHSFSVCDGAEECKLVFSFLKIRKKWTTTTTTKIINQQRIRILCVCVCVCSVSTSR